MVARRLGPVAALAVTGVLVLAAISYVAAQGAPGTADVALFDEGQAAGGMLMAQGVSITSPEGGAALEVAQEESAPPVVTLAQTAPMTPVTASTGEEVAFTTPTNWLTDRVWSDGIRTVVECTGDLGRTCNVNVFDQAGQLILGRSIPPSGEAADCGGPCLDSTGAVLDSSSISRAQAALDAGSRTHAIVTLGAPAPTTAEEPVPPDLTAGPVHEPEE